MFEEAGVDVFLSQTGGIEYFTKEDELSAYVSELSGLRSALGGDYPFDVLEHETLKTYVPEIGPKVVGGVFTQMDGHVNPLNLLRALTIAVRQRGGTLITCLHVVDVVAHDPGFTAILADGRKVPGDGLVLAAGLGVLELGHKLGFQVPTRPQQGQVLITEKLADFLRCPSGTLRQENEGGVQIGASKAEVGMDDTEDIATIANLAKQAVDVFPHLANVKLVRSWAALRVMSQDGLPVYQRSPKYQRASFVTCHSGITLSAAHAEVLPDWILAKNIAPDQSQFGEGRFDV